MLGVTPTTEIDPHLAVLLRQALACHERGKLADAETLYARILDATPRHSVAACNLAAIQFASGRARGAIARLQDLLKRAPDDAAAHYALSRIIGAQGPCTKSLYHLRRAVELEPGRLDAHLALIAGWGELKRLPDAQRAAEAAIRQFPDRPEPETQLGVAAIAAAKPAEARRLLEAAVARHPAFAPALYNLGRLLDDLGDMPAALALYRRARAADPDFEPAAFNAGDLELRIGDVAAAIGCFEASIARRPDDPAALSARLMAAQYEPGATAAGLAKLHALWEQRVGVKLRPALPTRTDRDPHRRLRVGLVSADLHEHPVGYFLIRALEARDPDAVDYVAYSGSDSDDPLRRRFRRVVREWRAIGAWSDARLADEIRRDRIDILIDLAGHTRDSRLTAFARCPAPLQLTWAGYVGTTGLAAMDGLIADRFQAPPGDEPHYVERVLRMPHGYVSYDPPAAAPEVTPLPAGADSPLTFASFHKPTKINRDVARLWARVLNAQAGARVVFAYGGYELPEVRDRIAGWFAAEGIGEDRLVFQGRLSHAALLALYGTTDMALDSFPYSGGLTTLEALWMGVPVVTLPGQSFAGRHSLSHLSVVGLTETIAADADDYVAIVNRLGADRPQLAALRAGLRGRLAASPVCDGVRFARDLQTLLRNFWREHCAAAVAAIMMLAAA